MANRLRVFISILVVFVVAAPGARHTFALSWPEPRGRINDFANLIPARDEKRLLNILTTYERRTGNELVVVTSNEKVDQRSSDDLFSYWRIGKPSQNNGILILATKEKKVFFSVGPRFRHTLNPTRVNQIIAKSSLSRTANDTGPELIRAVAATITALNNDRGAYRMPYKHPAFARAIVILFFLSMALFPWLAAILARSQPILAGAGAGTTMSLIMGLFAGAKLALLMLVFLAPLGYVLDRAVSANYKQADAAKTKPAWWAGGNWA